MNLSYVEWYFVDFLSVMELNEEIFLYLGSMVENGVLVKLKVFFNLFMIGIVNIDEIINMFSLKVLDRVNIIEFRVIKDEMESFLGNIKEINMDVLIGKGVGMVSSFLDMVVNKDFVIVEIDVINIVLVWFFGELKKIGVEFGYCSVIEIL